MFGYIYVNRKELSEEDRKDYQSYYCGLCQALRKSSGVKGQVLLNYDMTFLIILLSGLYELENKEEEFFCPLHLSLIHISVVWLPLMNAGVVMTNSGTERCFQSWMQITGSSDLRVV